MNELLTLSIEELRTYKQYLIGLIKDKTTSITDVKELQRKTRQIDKRIRTLLNESNNINRDTNNN